MATTTSFATTGDLQVLRDLFDTSQDGADIVLVPGTGTTSPQSDPNLTTNKPIVIVCHSLGGIVVKQALCVANKQFPRYGSIVNAIAGVIFLSTPHRYGDKTTSLMRYRDVPEATTGRNLKIPNANIEQAGAILLDLVDRFEGISFRTPILSVYELRESKNSSIPLRPKTNNWLTVKLVFGFS